jgi:glycosyltransferase involved in cell wall biosynthesis
MRLLQVAHLKEHVGGPFISVIDLHLAFYNIDHGNLLLVHGDYSIQDQINSISNSKSIKIILDKEKRISVKRISYKLLKNFYIISKEYDHLHFHGFFIIDNLLMLLICKFRRIPVSVQPHGSLMRYEFSKSPKLKAFFISIFILVVKKMKITFVVTSKIELEQLPTRICEIGKILHLTYQMSEIDLITDETFPDILPSLSSSNEINVLFLGRITPKKNLLFLARAINAVNESGENLNLICVGPLEKEETANFRLVSELLGSKFYYLGAIYSKQAKKQIFELSQIFALPSLGENFGLAALEANKAGLYCMLSENIGCIELLNPNTTIVLNELDLEEWIVELKRAVKLFHDNARSLPDLSDPNSSWNSEATRFLNFISSSS